MKHFPVRNKVRFAFWAAEEIGLLGSDQYVADLTAAAARPDPGCTSTSTWSPRPTTRYKLYDGDDSDATGSPAGPPGFGADRGRSWRSSSTAATCATVGTDFDGRSDYGPFIAVGIPAGGIFTGAEGIKTAEEAALFGGTAGVAYDICYHQACDTLANLEHDRAGRQLRRHRRLHRQVRVRHPRDSVT